MKADVNVELCVGCGLCADTSPDVFVMEADKAKVKATPVPEGALETCKKAQEDCPVSAISIDE